MVTLSTVGYGDKCPKSGKGMALGACCKFYFKIDCTLVEVPKVRNTFELKFIGILKLFFL